MPTEDQGASAPSRMVASWSRMASSGSTSLRTPRPWQTGQAPKGALNENVRGSSSSSESTWSLGQASFSEKRRVRFGSSSGTSTKSSTTTPSARPSADSTESVTRWTEEALTARRSMTTSMSCFSCFLSFGTSVRA